MRALVRLVVLALLMPVALAAQSPGDRVALDSWFDSVWVITSAEALAPLKPAAGKDAIALTRQTIWELRAAGLSHGREAFDKTLQTVDRALKADERSAYNWYLLGLVRQEMARRDFVAKSTNRQQSGVSYEDAALDAFQQSVRLDPSFYPAAAEVRRMLTLRAASAPPPGPSASNTPYGPFLSQARQSSDGGRYQDALAALAKYVDRGGSAAVAGLERSRALAALQRWTEAVDAYRGGLRRLDSAGRAEYRADISWIARNEELIQFDSLPLGDAGAWIERFFHERDALELRLPNERLQEHLRRVAYAYRHYLLLRPGDKPSFAQGIEARDYIDANDTHLDPIKVKVILELSNPIPRYPTYRRSQWDLDDRGALYIRHGEPAERIHTVAGPPNESWKYYFPDGPQIFHFLGSKALGTVAPTTLVASLPMDPEMLTARSSLDPRYAGLANRVEAEISGFKGQRVDTKVFADLGGSVVQSEIRRNQQAIAIGVSTDGFPHVFGRELKALATFYGVGLAPGEAPRLLTVVAVQARTAAVRVVAIDRSSGIIRQLDTTFTITQQDTLGRDQYLTGFVELPVPPGNYEVRALMTSPGTEAGATARRDGIEIVPPTSELALSDLILGQESAVRWRYRNQTIALNPLNAFPAQSRAELFYEVAGLAPGTTYETVVAVRSLKDDPGSKPAIEVTTSFIAENAYRAVAQGVGLTELKPGSYYLMVTLREKGQERSVTRRQVLNILEP